MEDLAYRRMLDLYYRTEKPLQHVEDVARLIRMKDHAAEVGAVLNEFFTPSDEGWRHPRCDAEIATFKAMAEGGRKGAAKRWGKASDSPPIATPSSPQCQPEPKPKPKPKEETKTARKRAAPAVLVSLTDLIAEGCDEQSATDWLIARKAKGLPLTPTAWADTKAEAIKAGLSPAQAVRAAAGNGWAGFKASWKAQEASPRNAGQPATVPMGANPADEFLAKMNARAVTATKPPPGLRERITG